jgi:protease PrsW
MILSINLLLAILGGFIPAIIWLLFWLQEDKEKPEPKKLIIKTFLWGMISVPFVLLFQIIVSKFFLNNLEIKDILGMSLVFGIISLFIFAFIEEVFKYIGADKGGLSKKENDEPIDPVIYMITSALGFSALENTLYILNPLLLHDTTTAFITGNFRFIGATLLHVASSAILGIALSFFYSRKRKSKWQHVFWGLMFATILHTIFNLFIIKGKEFAGIAFLFVWFMTIVIIISLEKLKVLFKKKKI